MPFGIQKYIKNQIALSRALEACAFEMLLEDFLFFTFHNDPAGIVKDYTRADRSGKTSQDNSKHVVQEQAFTSKETQPMHGTNMRYQRSAQPRSKLW